MKKTVIYLFLFPSLVFVVPTMFSGTFGSVSPGQPLWGVVQRVGPAENTVESVVDILELEVSASDILLNSQVDVVESFVDMSVSYAPTKLTSSDISAGTITLSTADNYCLSTDLTTDISITTSNISLDLSNRLLTGVIDVTGGNDLVVKNGTIIPAAPSSASDAALTLRSTASRVIIEDLIIQCPTSSGTNIAGRIGIEIGGDNVSIKNCLIQSGAASNGDASTVTASDGGDAIKLLSTADKTIILDCVLRSGAGASTSNAAGTGGRGGHGIYVNNATNAQILRCTVMILGAGGADLAGTGVGGDGGTGIKIDSSSADIAALHCLIGNTGAGGAGGTPGAAGNAVNDDVAAGASESIVYSNFAHNIANSTKYDLQASGVESGINTPMPPTSAVINSFANVYAS